MNNEQLNTSLYNKLNTELQDFIHELQNSPPEAVIEQAYELVIKEDIVKFYKMLVVDYLILNRDWHGANIEVLRNPKTKSIRLAPLFDHGLSLLCRCRTSEEIDRFDVLEDKKVPCYVGGNSARENLELIPKDKIPKQ